MTDGIVKKAGKKAAEEAKRAAKQVGHELVEIPKEAANQVTGTQTTPISEVISKGGTSAPVNPAQMKAHEKARLSYLEKELQELSQKKKLAEQQRQAAVLAAQPAPPKPSLVEPTTRPKRGLLAGLKGKQGTKEVMKPPSG